MKGRFDINRSSRTWRALGSLLFVCSLLWPFRHVLYAQVDTGSILGTIKDQSGAVVPNAKVRLTNEGTSVTLSTGSGPDGRYLFTPVKIGTYSVTAEVPGFQQATRPHLTLNIQQQLVVDFTLVPGAITQVVEVKGAPPLLQTQNAAVGQVVGPRAVNNLPLNGRNFTFLAQLVAGVNVAQQDNRGLVASGNFSANGNRSYQNNYLLDGMDNNSDLVDFLNGTYFVVKPSVDAIQEFKVQTNNYSAEFGRAGGAVLNATIKSGTNNLHGDFFEFLRNDRLDAADFFENAGKRRKSEFRQNQFGIAVGGPLVIPNVYNGKNRTFFFGDYEGTRVRQGIPLVSTVPTLAERASGFTDFSDLIAGQSGTQTDLLGRKFPLGTVFDPATTRTVTKSQVDSVTGLAASANGFARDPFARNIMPATRLDLNALKLLEIYPLPNGAGLFNNFTSNRVRMEDSNTFDARLDYTYGNRDTIFGRFSYDDDPQFIPGPFEGVADGGAFNQGIQTANSISSVFSETHSFSPSTVLESRAGYSRLATTRLQPFANTNGIPEQFGIRGIPQVALNGGLPFIDLGGLAHLGGSQFLPSDEINSTIQVTENVTHIYRSHTLKSGFEFQHVKFTLFQPPQPRGFFRFSGDFTSVPNAGGANTGRAQFILKPAKTTVAGGIDNVGGANQIQASNIANIDQRRNYYGVYLQDDWKISPKLTLNFGLRWEFFSPMTEEYHAEANLVPGPSFAGGRYLVLTQRKNLPIPQAFVETLAKDGIQLVKTSNRALSSWQKANFAPRFGFAYQVMPKFVIRGGYGLFYGGFENRFGGRNIGNNFPFQFQFNFLTPDVAHPITPDLSIGGLENGLLNVPLDPLLAKGTGIAFKGLNFVFETPYTQGVNFTTEYQLSSNQTIQAGYVGSFARHLLIDPGLNLPTVLLPPPANAQLFVPYPDFGRGGSFARVDGNSYYHSLQISFERRLSEGFNFLANYTFSKVRSDARDLQNNTIGGYRAPNIPGFGIQKDYALADFDIRNVFHFSGGYELPFGRGKHLLHSSQGALNHLVGGWSFNWIVTFEDGQPLTIPCSIGTAAGVGCFALRVPGQNPYAGKHNADQFINPAAFANPQPASSVGQTDFAPLGGAPAQVTGPPFRRLDFSIFKQFRTSETTRLEFRAEFFNLTNTPNLSLPGFSANSASAAPGALDLRNTKNFGKITSTRDNPNDPRQIQFALKFYF